MLITNEDIVGSLLPTVYLSRVILQTNKQDSLIANIQFVLKEQFANDDISSWLEDSDVLKYLKVFVIQSADSTLTEAVSNGIGLLGGGLKYLNERNFQILFQSLVDRGLIDDPEKLIYKEINLFQDLLPSITELVRQGKAEKVDNSDGSQSYNIYLNLDFIPKHLTSDLRHLSFIFGTSFDLTSLLGELVSEDNPPALGVSEVTVETVIDNGEIVSTSIVYVDEQERVWPGPVHFVMDSRDRIIAIRSGATETPNSVNLTRTEIENYKIQDFRMLRRMTDIQSLQLGGLENLVFNQSILNNIENDIKKQKDLSFCSDVYASVDNLNNVALTFFIDFKKMFKSFSTHGRMLDLLNTEASKKILNLCYRSATLESIIIKAKRIDLDQSLVPNNQNETIVAEFNGEDNISTIEIRPNLEGIRQNLRDQIRTFSLKLKQPLPSGTYEFSVEFGFKDGFVPMIRRVLQTLKTEQSKFKTYYKFATIPGVFNTKINRFTKYAFSQVQNLEELQDFSNSGKNYIQVLRKFYSIDITPQMITIINNWLDDHQGTPKSIYNVVALYDDLIKNFNSLLTLTSFINSSLNEKNEGTFDLETSTQKNKIISIKKRFNNILNLNDVYRLEYLNYARPESRTSNISSDVSYEQIKLDMLSKKIDPEYTISFSRNAEASTDEVYDKLQKIFSSFANLNIKKTPLITNQSNNFTQQNLQIAFQPNYQQITSLNENINVANFVRSLDKQVLNSALLALLNPTVNNNNENDTSFIISTKNSENIFWSIRPDLATLSVSRNSVSDLFKGAKISKNKIKFLPNQIKFLVKNKITNPQSTYTDARIRLKFEMLKQINYLIGFNFDQGTGTFNMNAPVWKVLNNLIDRFADQNDVIFCKMSDYENPQINYKFNNSLKQNCTNEYFIINNKDIDDSLLITDGASKISTNFFEGRSLFEINTFFPYSDNEVTMIIQNEIINPDDSITNSKYSFFSPVGVYFTNLYKSLGFKTETELLVIESNNFTMPTTAPVTNSISYRYERLNFVPSTIITQSSRPSSRLNPRIAAIYSRSSKGNRVK